MLKPCVRLCVPMALVAGLLVNCSDEPTLTRVPTPTTPPIAATVFATQLPTPAPTATLAPTPTPNANTLLAEAERAAHNGDAAQADALLAQALPLLGSQPEQATQATLSLARVRLRNRDDAQLANAISLLNSFAQQFPNAPTEMQQDASVLLARAYHFSQRYNEAIAQYTVALSVTSILSPYLNVWMGDAFVQLSQPISAVLPYQNAIAAAPSASVEFGWREKLALAHRLAGQRNEAAAQYQLILSRAQVPAYQARIKWELAQEQIALGQSPKALIDDLIANHPKTASAFEALKAALDSGLPVDELQRGIVNYHAGNHPAAREAFRRAIESPAGREDDIRYWAALNYISLELPNDAVRNLDQTIAANANPQRVAEAWAEKAKLYANLGNKAEALTALDNFARASAKTQAQAYAIGLAFERRQFFAEAIQAFELTASLQASATPDSDTLPALAKAAALAFRIGNPAQVISLTQGANANPLAQLWLGKAQLEAGDVLSGQTTLQALVQTKPDDYAGVRGNEVLAGVAPMSQPASPLLLGEGADGSAIGGERLEAEQWLLSWLTPTRALTDTPMLQDVRFARGTKLAQLGFEPEALGEFGALLNAYVRDPIALYQLSLHLQGLRLYRLSISAADALMRNSPFPTPSALPKFVARLLYPTYYNDLVTQYANEFGLDPLLVYSVIRQESLFESFAESSAAAQGLMQVIPSTGAEIARELSWPPNYIVRDLTRPFVSVRFGAYYLSKQKRIFEGDVYAALAAYNGGAGNALRWRERSGDDGVRQADPDVFFSVISFDETKLYVRNIAINYAMYRRIYSSA